MLARSLVRSLPRWSAIWADQSKPKPADRSKNEPQACAHRRRPEPRASSHKPQAVIHEPNFKFWLTTLVTTVFPRKFSRGSASMRNFYSFLLTALLFFFPPQLRYGFADTTGRKIYSTARVHSRCRIRDELGTVELVPALHSECCSRCLLRFAAIFCLERRFRAADCMDKLCSLRRRSLVMVCRQFTAH